MPVAESAPARPRRWGWLVLLTSSATLVCCVIPIVLVSLGFGAAVAAAWALFRPGRACPADPELARACASADQWNRRLLMIAAALWVVSFFTARLLTPLADWLGLF